MLDYSLGPVGVEAEGAGPNYYGFQMVFKPLAKYKDFVLIPTHQSGGGRKGKWVLEEANKLRCRTSLHGGKGE